MERLCRPNNSTNMISEVCLWCASCKRQRNSHQSFRDILVYIFLWLLQIPLFISFRPVSTHSLLSEGRYFNCAERTLNLSIPPLPLPARNFPSVGKVAAEWTTGGLTVNFLSSGRRLRLGSQRIYRLSAQCGSFLLHPAACWDFTLRHTLLLSRVIMLLTTTGWQQHKGFKSRRAWVRYFLRVPRRVSKGFLRW